MDTAVLDHQPDLFRCTSSVRSGIEIRGDDHAFLRSRRIDPIAPGAEHYRVVDLFAGAGGLSLAAVEAARSIDSHADIVYAADFDESAVACFSANFPDAEVHQQDLSQVFDIGGDSAPNKHEARLSEKLGAVDLLLGGPPCQGHSDLNNFSRRQDPKNSLYRIMGRAAKILRPTYVLIENVPGAYHDKANSVHLTISELESLGYFVDIGVADALHLGVPQARKRLVILASLAKHFSVQEIVRAYKRPVRDIEWAIGDIQDQEPKTLSTTPANTSANNRTRIDYLFDNELWDLPNSERPDCHRNGGHSYNSVYGRLRWDRPSQTITSGFYSVCMGRYVHPSRRRTLTAREAARLQFFPDFFDFDSAKSRTAIARVVGNAVPPKLAYPFLREMLLAGH